MYLITLTKTADIREPNDNHPMGLNGPVRGVADALPVTGERWVVSILENGMAAFMLQTSMVTAVWHDSDAREVVCETEHSRYFVRYTLDNARVNTLE